jgi:hypothetical protein
MNKYNLAIKNEANCDCINNKTKSCDSFDNRQQFINECINLINLKDGKINILDWESPTHGYIYYNPSNTEIYYPNKDFSLNKYNGEKPDYQHSPNLLKELNSLLNKNIIIESTQSSSAQSSSTQSSSAQSSSAQSSSTQSLEIPVYYLYCNKNNEIFNIFIIKSIMMYGNFNKFGDLFRINYNDNNTFITLSYKFNIFNISLFCGKFFDIIPLFLDRYEQAEITRKLNEIFAGFNFVNLFTTINGYKYMLKNISTNTSKPEDEQIIKELNNEFLQNKPKNLDPKFINKANPKYQDYKKLYNIENNSNTNENTQDKIISFLTESIIQIRNVFEELNGQIPDFDKLFLMSILSYRLKEGLINTTWPFNTNSIIKYIRTHSVNTEFDNRKLLKIYEIKKPIIYEYTKVFYKGEEYGNCMENTILQFLKILFYNPKQEIFDDDIIKKVVKPEYVDFIVNIFKRIDLEEKTTRFDLEWVEFITELPKSYPHFGIYNFLKVDKEINATLGNLILSLKCLTKIEYIPGTNPDTTFLNSIIKIINPNYSIIIKNEGGDKDIIIINCYNNYTMKLIHYVHANFESARIDKSGLTNILENIKLENESLIEYLNVNSYLTYSDISNYIFLISLVEKIDLINKYVGLLTNEKKQIYFNFMFSDSLIQKINPKIFDSIFNNGIKIEYFENFLNWENIFRYIESEKFWSWVIINNIYNSKWDEYKIRIAFSHIVSDIIWLEIVHQNIYLRWDEDFFKMAIKYIKSDIFWQDIVGKKIYSKWDENIWISAIKYIDSDIFWLEMVKIDVYIDIWKDYELKLLAIKNIKSDIFWTYITKNSIYERWDNYFWSIVFKYVKSNIFWKEIVDKLIYERWDKDFWINVIKYVKSDIFWKEISEKHIYIGWDIELWSLAVNNISYELLWDFVIDDENICGGWNNKIWIDATNLHKSVYFWYHVFLKKYYEKWDINVLSSIIDHLNFNIELKIIFEYIVDNNLCENWDGEIWEIAIENQILHDYEYFWKQVIVKRFYEKWNYRVWVSASTHIELKEFWEQIDISKINDEKIKQLIIENQSEYKYKYIKYKMKYLQLKKQFE